MIGTLQQDLRYGLRMLLKQPGFTTVAVLTLALGIGANSAIFSVVNAVLLRPLPLKEPERLVKLWENKPDMVQGTTSVLNLQDWREQNHVFSEIAAYQFASFNLQGPDNAERVLGTMVSPNFVDVVGVAPRLGRAFHEGEDQPGRHRVVLLSEQLWQRNFAGDPEAIGKSVLINNEDYTLIGVMPTGFRFPSRLTEIWVPLVPTQDQRASRGEHFLQALGRLKPDVTVEEAQQDMSVIGRRLAERYPNDQARRGILLIPLQEETVRFARPALLMLMAAVVFVLLIACVNVANLMLARTGARRREMAIRTALGAGRFRLVRQLLTESVILSVIGGAIGLLVAKWGTTVLVNLSTGVLPRSNEVGMDRRVVGFTLLLSVFTGLVFGLTPALQSAKADVQTALKEGGNVGEVPQRHWLRGVLVVIEVAASLVLVVGATLLIESFARLQQTDAGLRPDHALTVGIALPQAKYGTPAATAGFYEQLLERVATLPGVDRAGVINHLPMQQTGYNGAIIIEGQEPYPPGQAPWAEQRSISPDYFRALGIPLVAGRFFTAQDHEKAARVVIINQALARSYMPNEDPLGKRVSSFEGDWQTIVGVVGDVRESGITRPGTPTVFLPYAQTRRLDLTQSMTLVVRTASEPTALTPAVREAVRAVDPTLPVFNVKTMETVIADSVSASRLNVLLLGLFAAVALLLAVVGIYGVMSYTVTQSTREIGLRMALGAQKKDVLKLIIGQGAVLSLIGVALGVVVAFGLTRLIATLLYGVTANDPLTFVGASVLLMVVGLLACYVPARRAAKLDPMLALRYE